MKIDEKLDHIAADITEIKVTLGQQHLTLKDHMRRSLANEEANILTRAELKPVQEHVAMVNSVLKFIGSLGILAAMILAVVQIVQAFKGG